MLRTTFRFEPTKASRPAALKAVHEVLEVSAFDGTSFVVKATHAICTHYDDHVETVNEPGAVERLGYARLVRGACGSCCRRSC